MPQHNPHPVPDGPGALVPVEVRAWQDGYDAGISAPPDVPATPLVRDPDYARAWSEGAAAGNADGWTEGWRWAYFAGAVRPDAGSAAGGRYEPRPEQPDEGAFSFPQSWPCVGEGPLLVLLAHFSPAERGGDGLTGRRLARACADKGVPRLYLAVNLVAFGSAAERTGDPLADAGYWHGTVSESLDEAAPEAIAQVTVRVPRFAALVRYAPAAEHNFFDLLPVGGLLPPARTA